MPRVRACWNAVRLLMTPRWLLRTPRSRHWRPRWRLLGRTVRACWGATFALLDATFAPADSGSRLLGPPVRACWDYVRTTAIPFAPTDAPVRAYTGDAGSRHWAPVRAYWGTTFTRLLRAPFRTYWGTAFAPTETTFAPTGAPFAPLGRRFYLL
jgi:hypothetical protein